MSSVTRRGVYQSGRAEMYAVAAGGIHKQKWLLSWAGVLGGRVNNDGSFENATSNGYYWSSSYNDTNNAYDLNFNSGGNVNPQDNYNKNRGFAVRCLKNSEQSL